MPEAEFTTTLNLPRELIWEFVKDMNNWAPFLTGYQKHEIVSDTDSIWTLRGDVGVLARRVELKAHVTDWNGPHRVAFTLTGINEDVEGDGVLSMVDGSGEATAPRAALVHRSWFRRMLDAIFRGLFRRVHGAAPTRAATRAHPTGAASRLTFTLRMEAGGPAGPLVNAMLAPALLPAAEDLANKIAAHLEKTHAS